MDLQTLFDRKIDGSKKLIDGPATFTYGTLYKRCRQLYALFEAHGIVAGDRIGISTTDEIEFCCLFLCCLRLGIPVALIDPGARKAEATQLISKLHLEGLFLDHALNEDWVPEVSRIWTLKKQKGKLVSRLLGKKQSEGGDADNFPECLEPFRGSVEPLPGLKGKDQTALLLCTSGTTGTPKILPLSIANLLAASKTMTGQFGFNSETRMLNLLPLTHYDGMISGLFAAFYSSGTLVRLPPFTVSLLPDILDAISQYRTTHLLLTPAILGLMLRLGEQVPESFQTRDFQFVISVAATLPAQLWSDFHERTGKKVVNVYGLSESGNNFFAGPDEASYRIGSIGKPVDCRVAIVVEEGRRAGTGETGELLLQGTSIASGYLDQPFDTKILDGQSWLATGDLGMCDEQGVYWLAGRKKNIIIVGGRNVYPDEINNVLLSHSNVTEAATFGLPDEIWGERIVSCVVANTGISSTDLLDYVAKSLADYKVPREIHLLEELPKGRSGKVLVQELARQLHDPSLPKAAPADLEHVVLGLASASFRIPASELFLTTSPATCSRWDSVAHMDFVTNLESTFGVELLPREVIQITSIDAAVRIIRSKVA